MANPLITRQRKFAVKQEVTAGTPETLNATTGVMKCYDTAFIGDLPMNERPSEGTYDAPRPSIIGAKAGRITTRFEAIGGSSAPWWFANVAEPCGFSLSGVTLTSNGSSNAKCASAGCYQNGLFKSIAGAMGNLVLPFTVGEPFYGEVDLMGKYVAAADSAIIAPTYETLDAQRVASATCTVGSYTPRFATGRIVIENALKLREDHTDDTGYFHCVITNQRITVELDPEAALVAGHDAYGLLIAGTAATFTLVVGSGANVLTITIPGCQRQQVEDGDRDGILTHPITLLHTGTSAMTIVASGA